MQHDVPGLRDARADVVTARETVRRVLAGDDADLEAAAAMLDRALKAMCPHGPRAWVTVAPPPVPGETWVMCSRCSVAWQERDA